MAPQANQKILKVVKRAKPPQKVSRKRNPVQPMPMPPTNPPVTKPSAIMPAPEPDPGKQGPFTV